MRKFFLICIVLLSACLGREDACLKDSIYCQVTIDSCYSLGDLNPIGSSLPVELKATNLAKLSISLNITDSIGETDHDKNYTTTKSNCFIVMATSDTLYLLTFRKSFDKLLIPNETYTFSLNAVNQKNIHGRPQSLNFTDSKLFLNVNGGLVEACISKNVIITRNSCDEYRKKIKKLQNRN